MKHKNVHKDFIGKLASVRNLLKSRLPQFDVQNLTKIMSKLAHYHYDKNKYLIFGAERELYNLLIENGFNPYTVYRWLLLENLPDDIRFQIRQKKMTQKNAFARAVERRHETYNSLNESIREAGLNLVRRM